MGFDGKLFDIDDSVLAVARDRLDDIIDFLAKDCVLVFAGGGAASPTNPWDRGADSQAAPTLSVRLLIAWQERDFWVRLPADVRAPEGMIQTKGYVTDLDQVVRASHLLVQGPLASGQRAKFERAGDPVDPSNIIQGRYFVCNWMRVS